MKKFISIVALICMLATCLVSCGHEHEWGNWESEYESKATYSKNGIERRICNSCGEEEQRDVPALGDAGVQKYLNGHWREKGASKDDFLIDILFDGERFTAKVYMSGKEYSYMGGSGKVIIDEDRVTLKNDDGSTYIYFTYEIGNDTIVMIDYEISVWEKYEP